MIIALVLVAATARAEDLVYSAVTPCRIVDTRNAGGVIPANDFRNFLVSGSIGELAVQGGQTDCLPPKEATPSAITAYVITVPSAPGILMAYPSDQLPPPEGFGSTVNSATGQVAGNTTNITLCTDCPADGEFAILARTSDQHVVVDIQGYFYPMAEQSQEAPDFAGLEERLAELESKLDCMTGTSTDVFFDGCNVHIRNGLNQTDSMNGLGNLIIGYDLAGLGNVYVPPTDKSGSHNVVIGDEHTYSGYAGVVSGFRNGIRGGGSSAIGGEENTSDGRGTIVSGGVRNWAIGYASSISGGRGNWTYGNSSSVSGGLENDASGEDSSISGGSYHFVTNSGGWCAGELTSDHCN